MSSFVYVTVSLYCIACCIYFILIWLSYHPFSTVSVLDGRSILVNMIDIKLSKSLLTTVTGLLPFSVHSVVLVNPKALPLTG